MTSIDRPSSTENSPEKSPMLSDETHRRDSGSPTTTQPSMKCNQPSSKVASPQDSLLAMGDSLGRRGLLGIFGGSLWILGIFGFLAFIWCGQGSKPEAADATRLWRFIALHNYFPQTITLCALALRIAVGGQAAICTSMLAAIVLEKRGARRTQVGWLSVMCSINDGPHKLGVLLVSNKRIAVFCHVEALLTLLLILITLALQFSSTLLLSDINNFTIGDLNTTQFVFGEVQAGFNATPNADGLSDTGIVQRALLPIPESDARSSIRQVESTSLVMTSQSACIRPQINAVYSSEIYEVSEQDAFGSLLGTIDYIRSFERAGIKPGSMCGGTGCEDVAFECPIPSSTAGWATVTCLTDGIVRKTHPSAFDPIWDPLDGVWSINASISLLITSNTNYSYWSGLADTNMLPAGNPYKDLERFDTSMSAPGRLHEPRTDLLLTSKTYSTTDVQTFLGVSEPQRNHSDRRILDLKILGPPAIDSMPSPASQSGPQPVFFALTGGNTTVGRLTAAIIEVVMYYQITPSSQPNVSMSFCYFCITNGYSINPEISLLFNDITTKTGRAANALLSFTTIIFSSVYYTYLSTLRVSHDARMVAATTVQVPGPCSINGCVGFASVSALLLGHVLCVILITILYLRQVRYSRYENIWHAISQLTGDGLTDVLREAQNATDAEVERINDKGYCHGQVKVGRRGADGSIEIVNV
ncbi:hypothetical protein GGR55DRAFT_695792 [Xylaria sp. FL0064]|nr:hypothetical protein GGR55DRAFT_695792 [Xylaria sp. FL0064]